MFLKLLTAFSLYTTFMFRMYFSKFVSNLPPVHAR